MSITLLTVAGWKAVRATAACVQLLGAAPPPASLPALLHQVAGQIDELQRNGLTAMPSADEWGIPCHSILISGDGFEPGLQDNSSWLTSSAIFTLNLYNIWLNRSKVIISTEVAVQNTTSLQIIFNCIWRSAEYSPKSW